MPSLTPVIRSLHRLATTVFVVWYVAFGTRGMVDVCPAHGAGVAVGVGTHASRPASAHAAHATHTLAARPHADHATGHDHAPAETGPAVPRHDDQPSHQCQCLGDCCCCAAVRVTPVDAVALGSVVASCTAGVHAPVARAEVWRGAHVLPFATAPPDVLTA